MCDFSCNFNLKTWFIDSHNHRKCLSVFAANIMCNIYFTDSCNNFQCYTSSPVDIYDSLSFGRQTTTPLQVKVVMFINWGRRIESKRTGEINEIKPRVTLGRQTYQRKCAMKNGHPTKHRGLETQGKAAVPENRTAHKLFLRSQLLTNGHC